MTPGKPPKPRWKRSGEVSAALISAINSLAIEEMTRNLLSMWESKEAEEGLETIGAPLLDRYTLITSIIILRLINYSFKVKVQFSWIEASVVYRSGIAVIFLRVVIVHNWE